MYFALAGMMEVFEYLHYGLAGVLIFIGTKMLIGHYYRNSDAWLWHGSWAILAGLDNGFCIAKATEGFNTEPLVS